jgi:hypothetical protein
LCDAVVQVVDVHGYLIEQLFAQSEEYRVPKNLRVVALPLQIVRSGARVLYGQIAQLDLNSIYVAAAFYLPRKVKKRDQILVDL